MIFARYVISRLEANFDVKSDCEVGFGINVIVEKRPRVTHMVCYPIIKCFIQKQKTFSIKN